MNDHGWWRRAACLGTPLYLWFTFPPNLDRADRRLVADICRQCPVRAACERDAAVNHADRVTQAGYWYWRPSLGRQKRIEIR